MFNKKKNVGYWHVFILLLFCFFLFIVSKLFMKAVSRDESKRKNAKKKSDESDSLFI